MIELIDKYLDRCNSRQSYSVSEVVDMLLDLRKKANDYQQLEDCLPQHLHAAQEALQACWIHLGMEHQPQTNG